jgi:hypothetical protein
VKLSAKSRWQRGGKPFAVFLMLLLWLGTFALTASPELHRVFHPDSKNPSHRCLITQIQHQPLLAGFAAPVAPVSSPSGLAVISPSEFQFVPVQDTRLSFSRGPPSFVSSFPVAG